MFGSILHQSVKSISLKYKGLKNSFDRNRWREIICCSTEWWFYKDTVSFDTNNSILILRITILSDNEIYSIYAFPFFVGQYQTFDIGLSRPSNATWLKRMVQYIHTGDAGKCNHRLLRICFCKRPTYVRNNDFHSTIFRAGIVVNKGNVS